MSDKNNTSSNIFLIHKKAKEKSRSGYRVCMYGHATTQPTYSRKLFPLQHPENTSTVSECSVCVIYEEKYMSIILMGDYVTLLFFPRHSFYFTGFFHDDVFNETVHDTR